MSEPSKSAAEFRNNDADVTRNNILEIAAREFAAKGLAGARIDEIAEKTNSSKRMIYYYFGGKEELYRAVLEQSYAGIRAREEAQNVESLPADEALAVHVGSTFDYHNQHPEFVRLVMNENIHNAAHLAHIPGLKDRNQQVIATMQAIIDKGVAAGIFKDGLDPIDLHMTISALAFYNVSNRATFGLNFGRDMGAPEQIAKRRAHIIDIVLGSVKK